MSQSQTLSNYNISPSMDKVNQLQKQIQHLQRDISSTNSNQCNQIYFEDQYITYCNNQQGHQLIKIKVNDGDSALLTDQVNLTVEQLQRQKKQLLTKVQEFSNQLNNLKQNYQLLINYLHIKNLYVDLPSQLKDISNKIQQSLPLNMDNCFKLIQIEGPERIVEVQKLIQVEKVVQIQKILTVQKIIEIPIERLVQIEIPAHSQFIRQIQKIVQVPVYIEKIVQIQKIIEVTVEKIIQVQKPIFIQKICQKIVEVSVQKIINVEIQKYIDRVVEVTVDRVVQVPTQKIVYVQKIVEVPVEHTVQIFIQKRVQVPVMKIVEVQKINQVQKILEMQRIVQIQKIIQIQKSIKLQQQSEKAQKTIEIIVQKLIQIPVQKIIQVEIEKIVYVQRQIQVSKEVIIEKQVFIDRVEFVQKEVIVEKEIIVQKVVQVPIQIIKIVQVYVQKIVEVQKQKIVQIYKIVEVQKIVQVQIEKIVVKEVQVIKQQIKQIQIEVIKQIRIEVPVIKQVIKEIPIEKIKQVTVQVTKQIEIIKQVPIQLPIQVIKEVIKTIQIIKEVPIEIIKEEIVQVIKQLPVQTIKQIQVIKEIEIIKYIQVIKDVQVIKQIQVIKQVQTIKEVPIIKEIEVIKEVQLIKYVQVEKEIVKQIPVEIIKQVLIYTQKLVFVQLPTQIILLKTVNKSQIQKDFSKQQDTEILNSNIQSKLVCQRQITIDITEKYTKAIDLQYKEIKSVQVEQQRTMARSHSNQRLKIANFEDVKATTGLISDRSYKSFYSNQKPDFIEHQLKERSEISQNKYQQLLMQNNSLIIELENMKQNINEDNFNLRQKKRFEAELKEALSEKQQLQDNVMNLEKQNMQLSSQNLLLQQNIRQCTQRNQNLFEQNQSLTQRIEQYKNQIKTLINQYQSSQIYRNQTEKTDLVNAEIQLKCQKEENQNLRNIVQQMNEKIQKQKYIIEQQEHNIHQIIVQRDKAKQLLLVQDQSEEIIQKNKMVIEAMQKQLVQNEQFYNNLRKQNDYYRQNLEELLKQHQELKIQYKEQAENSDSKTLMIEELKYQIQQLNKQVKGNKRETIRDNRQITNLYPNRKYLDVSDVRSNDEVKQSRLKHSNSSGNLKSTRSYNTIRINRNDEHKLNLKSITTEIKRLLGQIVQISIADRVNSLVKQLYVEAEYRQRSSAQMRSIIIELQQKVAKYQRQLKGREVVLNNREQEQYINNLHQSIKRYERMITQKDNERHGLLTEISNLSKQNYQIRMELVNIQQTQQIDNRVYQFQAELEKERAEKRQIKLENSQLKNELIEIERTLNEKNQKIKLLTLNLNRKDLHSSNGYSHLERR